MRVQCIITYPNSLAFFQVVQIVNNSDIVLCNERLQNNTKIAMNLINLEFG